MVRSRAPGASPAARSPTILRRQSPDDIKLTRQENPDGPGLVRCFVQAEPARKLKNLSSIPIIIVLGEASYHAPYDHCTSKWLTQAGRRRMISFDWPTSAFAATAT